MVLREFKYLIVGVFLLLSCSTRQSYYQQENNIDSSGIKRNIIICRLFVDGRMQENRYDSYYGNFKKTSTNYEKIFYADLIIGAVNTYSYSNRQHSGYDGNRLTIAHKEKAMVLYFDKKMIGKIYT